MEILAKLLGYSIFGVVFTSGLIVFVSSAAKICVFLYSLMNVPRAVVTCIISAVLFGWLVGLSNPKR